MDYDVVVAGAGPVGLATARDIARADFKVLVVEEDQGVGECCFCSGLVTPRALGLAAVSDAVVFNALRGAVVHSASGKELVLGGDRVHALAIDRPAFDRALAEQAHEAGAEILLCSRLLHIERRNDRLRLTLAQRGRPLSMDTRLLIGADGANSVVAHWLNGGLSGETVVAATIEARLRTRATDLVDVFVGKSLAPGWFGWIIPLGDNLARVGIGSSKNGGKPLTELLKGLFAFFPHLFESVEAPSLTGHVLPLYAPIKTYGHHVLLVSDAARQVKPTTGVASTPAWWQLSTAPKPLSPLCKRRTTPRPSSPDTRGRGKGR